jgi:hypothetical protein
MGAGLQPEFPIRPVLHAGAANASSRHINAARLRNDHCLRTVIGYNTSEPASLSRVGQDVYCYWRVCTIEA